MPARGSRQRPGPVVSKVKQTQTNKKSNLYCLGWRSEAARTNTRDVLALALERRCRWHG